MYSLAALSIFTLSCNQHHDPPSEVLSSCKIETLSPINNNSHSPSNLWQPLSYFFISVTLTALGTSLKWDHAVFWLAWFPLAYVLRFVCAVVHVNKTVCGNFPFRVHNVLLCVCASLFIHSSVNIFSFLFMWKCIYFVFILEDVFYYGTEFQVGIYFFIH